MSSNSSKFYNKVGTKANLVNKFNKNKKTTNSDKNKKATKRVGIDKKDSYNTKKILAKIPNKINDVSYEVSDKVKRRSRNKNSSRSNANYFIKYNRKTRYKYGSINEFVLFEALHHKKFVSILKFLAYGKISKVRRCVKSKKFVAPFNELSRLLLEFKRFSDFATFRGIARRILFRPNFFELKGILKSLLVLISLRDAFYVRCRNKPRKICKALKKRFTHFIFNRLRYFRSIVELITNTGKELANRNKRNRRFKILRFPIRAVRSWVSRFKQFRRRSLLYKMFFKKNKTLRFPKHWVDVTVQRFALRRQNPSLLGPVLKFDSSMNDIYYKDIFDWFSYHNYGNDLISYRLYENRTNEYLYEQDIRRVRWYSKFVKSFIGFKKRVHRVFNKNSRYLIFLKHVGKNYNGGVNSSLYKLYSNYRYQVLSRNIVFSSLFRTDTWFVYLNASFFFPRLSKYKSNFNDVVKYNFIGEAYDPYLECLVENILNLLSFNTRNLVKFLANYLVSGTLFGHGFNDFLFFNRELLEYKNGLELMFLQFLQSAYVKSSGYGKLNLKKFNSGSKQIGLFVKIMRCRPFIFEDLSDLLGFETLVDKFGDIFERNKPSNFVLSRVTNFLTDDNNVFVDRKRMYGLFSYSVF